MFKCSTIDKDFWMTFDLQLFCWQGSHLKWTLIYFLPILIVVSFGMPLSLIVFLSIKWKSLEHHNMWWYVLIIYQGLWIWWFYWDLINMIRKILLLIINVFIPDTMITYKIFTGFLFLFAYLWLQIFLQPFKLKIYNKLEEREIMCSIISLYAGVLFTSSSEIPVWMVISVFVIVIIINYLFFSMLFWCYLDSMNLKCL